MGVEAVDLWPQDSCVVEAGVANFSTDQARSG